MKTLQTIHHKKNEIQEVEFFKDAECTEDFESKSHLYYLHNADCEAILKCVQELEGIFIIPYISKTQIPILSSAIRIERLEYNSNSHFLTLSDTKEYNKRHFQTLLPNLSKYTPEDNAVLFLSEEDMEKYKDCFPNNHIGLYTNDGKNDEVFIANNTESLINGVVEVKKGNTIIFLKHGTKSEIRKAEELARELKEKYGVDEVNLFVLHCFTQQDYILNIYGNCLEDSCLAEDVCNFNKIITTNSTGILKPEDSTERLQVIDAKEIFEEYLNGNNLID